MAFRVGGSLVVLGLCLLYLKGGVGQEDDGEAGEQDHGISKTRLILDLLRTYHSLVLPKSPVNVSYGLELVSIDGLDEKENILRFSAYSMISWLDQRLQWSPAEFNGLSYIHLPPDEIWTPDLKLYAQVLEEEDFNLRAYRDGTIYHSIPMRLALPCSMHFAYYPFDVQTCALQLGSWTYDSTMINLTLPEMYAARLHSYRENSQWELLSFTADRQVTKYACCEETYISVTFRVQVRRRVGEYAVRVLAPSVVTSLLVLLCFLAPPRGGVRLVYCSVLLLCLLLQLFHLNLTVPISGPDAPFLADFLCFVVFLVFFAAVESVVALNLLALGRGSGNNNALSMDGDDVGMQLPAKPNTGLARVARFLDVGCFLVFTFIFAVAGGVILNPKAE